PRPAPVTADRLGARGSERTGGPPFEDDGGHHARHGHDQGEGHGGTERPARSPRLTAKRLPHQDRAEGGETPAEREVGDSQRGHLPIVTWKVLRRKPSPARAGDG